MNSLTVFMAVNIEFWGVYKFSTHAVLAPSLIDSTH